MDFGGKWERLGGNKEYDGPWRQSKDAEDDDDRRLSNTFHNLIGLLIYVAPFTRIQSFSLHKVCSISSIL